MQRWLLEFQETLAKRSEGETVTVRRLQPPVQMAGGWAAQNLAENPICKGGKRYLKAENPKYPNLIPSEELVIQGVFRGLIRKA